MLMQNLGGQQGVFWEMSKWRMARFARYEVLCREVGCYGLSARTKIEKDVIMDGGEV